MSTTKYMQQNVDAFQHLSLGAGVLCTDFTPSDGTVTGLLGVTTGGVTFNQNPEYEDWAEDIDQAPNNMLQYKRLVSMDPTMSGTFLEVTAATIKRLAAAADIDTNDETHIIPRSQLIRADFSDIWWVGDYSDVNTGERAGYLAIHLKNALNTTGFQITAAKNSKGQYAFEFHGHYSIDAQDEVPYEIYIKEGVSAPASGG